MPQTLAHSPGDIVRRTLIALGVGSDPAVPAAAWPVYAEGEPDSPDSAITVYTTQGGSDGRSMIDGELFGAAGVQVRVRSAAHTAGWVKANAARVAMAVSTTYDRTVVIGAATYLI